jgi:CheY-like chemotaxis protein/phosphoribosyl 1,2-cyclic phosphodiesterase
MIFDCGTGARMLGEKLANENPGGLAASIFLGHTHWDHIQGFPFFRPLFMKGSRINIFAPGGGEKKLADVLSGQMEYAYFPVRLEQLQSAIEFRELGEDRFTLREVQIETQYLNHTAVTLGYRLFAGDVTMVYATDHEPHIPEFRKANGGSRGDVLHPGDQRHIRFMEGADLVIHDAQYSEEEYGTKVGWGHSTVEYATEVAAEAGVKRLVLFHHDPAHSDEIQTRLVERCRLRAKELGSSLEVIGAKEGDEIEISEQRRITPPLPAAANPILPSSARILIVDNETQACELIVATLEDEGYHLIVATSGPAALAAAFQTTPDLVLLDVAMPGMDGREVCRKLREDERTHEIPIVMLTAAAGESDVVAGFEWGATDYMTKPFSPSQLKARVRSWLLRGAGRKNG